MKTLLVLIATLAVLLGMTATASPASARLAQTLDTGTDPETESSDRGLDQEDGPQPDANRGDNTDIGDDAGGAGGGAADPDAGGEAGGTVGVGDVAADETATEAQQDQQEQKDPQAESQTMTVSVSRPASRPRPADWVPPCARTGVQVIEVQADGYQVTATVCTLEYVCGSERIDDIVNGHIEQEADGAYAEYVIAFASFVDDNNASIIQVESNPVLSDGEVAPEIPLASDSQGLANLTRTLASSGLGDSPGQLYLPVLNYCRLGSGGPIEADPNPTDPRAAASFGWIPLGDEYDIPGASTDVYDEVRRQLLARRAEIHTIPPTTSGVTVVQFPMWLWLEEFDPVVEATAISEPLGTTRVQGRATFDHAIWKMGTDEVRCELNDMKPYEDHMDLFDPAERPACHHIFQTLQQYRAEVTLNYRIERQIATRRSPTHPYVATGWEPHPNGASIPVTTIGPDIRVEEIHSVNVPIDS